MVFKLFCFFLLQSSLQVSCTMCISIISYSLVIGKHKWYSFIFYRLLECFFLTAKKFKFRHSRNDRCCETKLSRMSMAFWGTALKRLVLLFAWIKKKKKAPSRRHISFLLADAKKGKKIHTPSLWKLHFDYLQHSSCFSSKMKEEKKWHPVASRKGEC